MHIQVVSPQRDHMSGMSPPGSALVATVIPARMPELVGGVRKKLLTKRGIVAGASDTGGGVAADLEGKGEGKV